MATPRNAGDRADLAFGAPSLPRRWVIVPYLLGACVSLILVSIWLTPQPLLVRLGLLAAAAVVLAVGLVHQAGATTARYGNELSNAALTLANQQLATMNEHLHLLATTDPLTGLPNRAVLQDSLVQALRPGPRSVPRLALLLLDLDRFKEVNDTLGHHTGDLLLQQFAARLQETLAGAGSIVRLGGDEFAVLLPEADAQAAGALAQRCLDAFTTPFVLDDHTLHVGGSIGVALAPEHGQDASTLLRCADVAMYVAKRRHLGYAIYTPASDQHSPRLLQLVGELQQAILQGGLCLYYQPKVRLETGQVCGMEALVRWRHADHGLISPDQFIPVAEQTGLIGPLTHWVLHQALDDCRRWQEAGLALTVAVNLSMRNLQDPHLPEVVAGLLQRTAVAPAMVTLEITESLLMADPASALEVLTRLDALGVRLSIDDFGTGHSSLGYLKQLPVDELKIDQAFVLNLNPRGSGGMRTDRMIVRSVTALAHALGLEVVAEGVETRQTYDLLAALRCNVGQGYYVSRPMPMAEVESWVRSAAILPAQALV